MIGIIAAEFEEMSAIKEYMINCTEEIIYNLKFYKGIIKNKECVIVQCGVGKVNAARTTQILIDKFSIDYVINIGSAGSVTHSLDIGDIVIGKELVQYDFDITGIGNYERGEIFEVGKLFHSDKRLTELCLEAIQIENDNKSKMLLGRIGTADLFCSDPEIHKKVKEEFDVLCVEMEGAAVGQVCTLDNIPFLVIRSISDTPNGNNKVDFHIYLEHASKKAAEILYNLIEKI